MDLNYGIGVKNRYALFMGDEESDPSDIISKSKEEASSSSTAAAVAAVSSSAPSKKASTNKKSTTNSALGGNTGNAESKIGAKDMLNGGSVITAKTKQPQVVSNKVATTPSNFGKPQNKESSTLSSQQLNSVTTGSTNSRKGGENRPQNRPPRQDRVARPAGNSTNASGFGTSPAQENNSWPQSGLNALRDQKDIEERKNRRNREDRGPGSSTFSSEFRDRGEDGSRGRGSRGGRGGFRGRGRGRGGSYDNRGKREYDRQSGSDKTGIKPVEKREGSGAHNWGTLEDELEGQINPNLDDTQDINERSGDENPFDNSEVKEEVDVGGDVPEEKDEVKDAEEVAEDEAAKEMTLEEWKKIEEEKRAKPIFNLRKPGEGEDNAQWKKTYVLKKKKEEDDEEEDEYEEVEVEEEIRHGRQKRILDIEINFKDENRDTRRGRGRGGARGGPSRGGGGRGRGPEGERADRSDRGSRRGGGTFRRDAKEQSTPKVDDWDDFPSLAAA